MRASGIEARIGGRGECQHVNKVFSLTLDSFLQFVGHNNVTGSTHVECFVFALLILSVSDPPVTEGRENSLPMLLLPNYLGIQ